MSDEYGIGWYGSGGYKGEEGTNNKVTLRGRTPLYIRGPFIMKLGNIDLNGLNIEIGSNNLTEHSAIIILE